MYIQFLFHPPYPDNSQRELWNWTSCTVNLKWWSQITLLDKCKKCIFRLTRYNLLSSGIKFAPAPEKFVRSLSFFCAPLHTATSIILALWLGPCLNAWTSIIQTLDSPNVFTWSQLVQIIKVALYDVCYTQYIVRNYVHVQDSCC